MEPLLTLKRRRRQLALGALTVLLHLLVFEWFSGQLRPPPPRASAREAPLVTAALVPERPASPAAPSEPALPQPSPPQLAPPPLPVVQPEPVVAEAASEPAGPPSTADAAPGADAAGATAAASPGAASAGDGIAGRQAGAAGPAAGVASGQPVPTPAPQQAAPAPRYKVDLPPSADITLDVARVDADGTKWSGEALLSWTVDPSAYRIRIEAGIGIVFTRVNLLTLTSEGAVGEEGFVPILMTEKRRGRAMTATHFNRKEGTLTFSASQAKYALVPGAQDKASVPLQLAAIARGDPRQLTQAEKIDILVGEDRDASVFSFVVAGQEQIDTRLGRIAAWHLVRPPKPGSYSSRLELWLAPGYGWVPVQIRNVEASGAVTTQTVSKIETKEAGS